MRFQLIETADGSPSIDYFQSSDKSESMHNRKGAFSETLYIYLSALQKAHENQLPLSVLSVGLGLGYNEILTAAFCEKYKIKETYLESFESLHELRTPFTAWVEGRSTDDSWFEAYDKICDMTALHFNIPPSTIKDRLLNWKNNSCWLLRNTLENETSFTTPFSVILFDAYSSNTSPQLWDDEFFEQFLPKATRKNCIFSTYAAKGTLNRALKKFGFSIEKREGFGGKRQSTFAIR